MKRLLIGSGAWHWAGWLTLDANPENKPDVLAVVPPLPPEIMERQFVQILASHFIEHIFIWQARDLLKQCHTILVPGGTLTLELPNLDYCCKVMAGVIDPPPGRNREQFSYWGIFGAPNGNPWDGHRAGYTPETLSDLVVEAGFDRAKITISPGIYHEPVRDFQLQVIR